MESLYPNLSAQRFRDFDIIYALAVICTAGGRPFRANRRDGRVVECTGLENRRAARSRGFESLSLRQVGLRSDFRTPG